MVFKYINFILYAITALSLSLLTGDAILACMGCSVVPFHEFCLDAPDRFAFVENFAGWGVEDGAPDQENSSITIKIWPNGMRKSRERIVKENTKLRVAFVGCSYTFGTGVEARDTMVWYLNDKYPQVAFDNWGMPGFGPAQIYLTMNYLFSKYRYDLIVYNALGDHMFRNYKMRALGSFDLNSRYAPIPYANWNIFGVFRIRPVYELRWPFESDLLTSAFLKRIFYAYKTAEYERFYTQRSVYSNKDCQTYTLAEECYTELINRMYELCRVNNADFLVCVLEDSFDLCKQEDNAVTKNQAIRCEVINADMPEGKAHKAENRVLNNPAFHPNGNLHKYWADRFSDWFDKKYGNRVK